MSTWSPPSANLLVRRIADTSRRPANLGEVPGGVISLAIGEPGEATPSHIVEGAIAALRAGRTRYSPAAGITELRRAIVDHLAELDGVLISADRVVLSHGAAGGLASVFLALLNPGDAVVIPEPTYSLYVDHTAMADAEHHWVPLTPARHLDVPAIEARVVATGARLLVLCNPGNPTGAVYTREELEELAGLLRRHPELRLICDEAYCDIILGDRPFWSALRLGDVADQVVVVRTFSKSYAMTGWRLGYVIGPLHLINDIALVHRTFAGPLNTAVQYAALAALVPDPVWDKEQTDSYRRRRDIVFEYLEALPSVTCAPTEGAFYAFVNVDSPLKSDELTTLLAEGGVLVRSGAEYGPSGEGCVRISFATDEATLRTGMQRFVSVIAGLSR